MSQAEAMVKTVSEIVTTLIEEDEAGRSVDLNKWVLRGGRGGGACRQTGYAARDRLVRLSAQDLQGLQTSSCRGECHGELD